LKKVKISKGFEVFVAKIIVEPFTGGVF